MKLKDTAESVETAFSLIERIHAWLPYIIGTAGVSAVSGWAAYATQSLNRFGAVAWVASGLMGGLLFMLICVTWLHARMHGVRLAHARALAQASDVINPLDDVFTKKRIRLEHFIKPFTEPVVGKTFVDCELMGPIVLYFAGKSNIVENNFKACDLVKVKEGARVNNVLPLQDVTVKGCTIYQATILVPASLVSKFPSDAPWISS